MQGRPAASPTRYGGYNDRINNSCGFDQSDSHSKRSKLPSDTAAAKPPRPSFSQISSYPHTFFLYIFSSQQTRCARTLARSLSGSVFAFRLADCLRSGICLASALLSPPAPPLKYHALKRCTSWRETCLASVFALRLASQRARAADCLLRLVPSQRLLGNKSRRSVYPFQLRFHLFSWNRTILRLVPSQLP